MLWEYYRLENLAFQIRTCSKTIAASTMAEVLIFSNYCNYARRKVCPCGFQNFKLFSVITLISLTLYIVYLFKDSIQSKTLSGPVLLVTNINRNEYTANQSTYLVHTSTCKIGQLNPFDPSISNFLSPDPGYPYDCKGSRKWWTYINDTVYLINISLV